MKHLCFALLILFVACQPNHTKSDQLLNLEGDYLGQSLPDSLPEIFAPGIINTGKFTRDITMTPEGDEIWFSICGHAFSYGTILFTKRTEEGWTQPQVAPFATNSKYHYIEPFISPDGKYLYFASNCAEDLEGEVKDFDIWRCERLGTQWGEPVNIGWPVNTAGDEFFPSITSTGTIYYTSETQGSEGVILKALATQSGFAQPDSLPRSINCGRTRYNAFISPDESFLIQGVWGLEDSYGGTDYYIFFRDEKGEWSQALNMGDKVNSKGHAEYAASLSPDGNYLFFMSDRVQDTFKGEKLMTAALLDQLHNTGGNGLSTVYWMRSDFINTLRKQAQW
ncbi:TolB family protein [Carboxylicivirga taeanensis]|uniref:TolB family protein n=1 Tax=Carboxylicivirga taeanensis TaxID=1416875 RepID=UPI003F6E244C